MGDHLDEHCFSGSPSLCFSLIAAIQFVILHSWLNKLTDSMNKQKPYSYSITSLNFNSCLVSFESANCHDLAGRSLQKLSSCYILIGGVCLNGLRGGLRKARLFPCTKLQWRVEKFHC